MPVEATVVAGDNLSLSERREAASEAEDNLVLGILKPEVILLLDLVIAWHSTIANTSC